jgi:hypothetical protein
VQVLVGLRENGCNRSLDPVDVSLEWAPLNRRPLRAGEAGPSLADPRVLPQRGMAFADRLRWGRESHPLRTLLIAANRMVKLNMGGAGMALLWGRRWARLPYFPSKREKYCHNGAWSSLPITASTCLGVHDGDRGQFRRTPETG